MSTPRPVQLTRTVRFCAAHRYHSDALSEEENERVFGKCHRPHGHGHNYRLDLSVAGPVDPITGMVVNLADLDRILKAEVVERLDHNFLNLDVPHFASVVPTCENIALYIRDLVVPLLAALDLEVSSVRLWESEDLYAEVRP